MAIALPADVSFILDTLQAGGNEAYIVGGCVRDSLLSFGSGPKDWDIATSALPHRVKDLFPNTFDTGVKHGTVTVVINRMPYEVTTFREDGEYLDSRRPSFVIFSSGIENDLSRRDFTMNAIAYNPLRGFVDPFNGRDDIAKSIIRCVGKPENRFNEDALRMLRAVRFTGQLGFTLDESVFSAISESKDKLTFISAERIREELTRLLCSPFPEAIHLLEKTGLSSHVLCGHAFSGNMAFISNLLKNCPNDTNMRCALFLYWAGLKCGEILKDMRFDNKSIKEVSLYIHALPCPVQNDSYLIKKSLSGVPFGYFEKLIKLQGIFHNDKKMAEAVLQTALYIIEKNECYDLRHLAVNGGDLIKAGIPPGKKIGETLQRLLDIVMKNPELNQKELLMDFL